MELPANNEDYREQTYWDTRYQKEDKYDWFSSYISFQHLLSQDVKPTDKILTLGCGNSTLSEEMYKDGYRLITNTDFSPVVIEKMAAKHKDLQDMTWLVMDICDLQFEPGSFDVVLEKGTLDALMVHEKDPWDISVETLEKIDTILNQVKTILKPGGKFISITFSQPHFRRPLYACSKYNWDVNLSTFGNSFHFFYFVMNKGKCLSEKDQQNEVDRQKRKQERSLLLHSETVFLQNDDSDGFLLDIDMG